MKPVPRALIISMPDEFSSELARPTLNQDERDTALTNTKCATEIEKLSTDGTSEFRGSAGRVRSVVSLTDRRSGPVLVIKRFPSIDKVAW